MKKGKKLLGKLTALAMVCSLLPVPAVYAAEETAFLCGKEVHAHEQGCYALICDLPALEPGETITAEEGGTEVHIHGKDCYGEELICDTKAHSHTEECLPSAEEPVEQEESEEEPQQQEEPVKQEESAEEPRQLMALEAEPPQEEEESPQQPTDTHSHPVCGDSSCDHSSKHDEVENWTAVDSEHNLTETIPAGSYYLAGDVEAGTTLTITGNVALCLNGNKLNLKDGAEGSLIQINRGGTLTLCDCESGGTLSGNQTVVSDTYGGGSVVTVAGGAFDMYGGTISGNDAKNGGGVYVGQNAAFNMHNGMISGNNAENGGGVYVDENGTFIVNGGVISGNTSSSDQQVKSSNVKVFDDAPFTVGNSLAEGTLIYVDHEAGKEFTNTGVPEGAEECFWPSNNDHFVLREGNNDAAVLKVVDSNGLPAHTHYACGGSSACAHTEHAVAKGYIALVSIGNPVLTGGSYYLYRDLQVTETLTITGKVNLCLNGHQLSLASGATGPLFLIKQDNDSKGELTLCDCKGGGKLVGNDTVDNREFYGGGSVVTVAPNGTFNMYNGTITGNTAKFGGGVYVGLEKTDSPSENNSATFNMYGGEISGNEANDYEGGGGGVYLNDGQFNMHDGVISDNKAIPTEKGNGGSGGGVHVEKGIFSMHGGEISGNTAQYGGGVYLFNNNNKNTAPAMFIMDGGTISENAATKSGGGVFVSIRGQFVLQGDASIQKNEAAERGGGVYAADGTFTMDSGKISGNKSTNDGGGVFVEKYGTFTMNNGTISGNNSDRHGGGVAVVSGVFTISGGTISSNTSESTGGGVYVFHSDSADHDVFIVAGGVISNNRKGTDDPSNGGTPSNVYVDSGKPFKVEVPDSGMPTGTEIYVDHGLGAVFTNEGLPKDTAQYFHSPDADLQVVQNTNNALEIKVNTVPNEMHSHAPCGSASCRHANSGHTPVEYTELASDTLGDIAANVNYNLFANLEMEQPITIKEGVTLNLCLNGHELLLKSGQTGPLFKIEAGGTLVLCDCAGGGRIASAEETVVSNAGTFYVYGGMIEEAVSNVGTFCAYGGTLKEIALKDSGKVYLAAGAEFVDGQLTVGFTGSEQIYAEPALLSGQIMTLRFDGSTVPKDSVVVSAWKADETAQGFASETAFVLENAEAYELKLQNENKEVVLTERSTGGTGGTPGGKPDSGSGSNPGSKPDSSSGNHSGGGSGNSVASAGSVKSADTENGTITLSEETPKKGETVIITVTPDVGYALAELRVTNKNGKIIEVKELGKNQYSFVAPGGEVRLEASFRTGYAPEEVIILTVDEEEAQVFGEAVTIDAAPVIRNSRTMLPIRLIAESLGAQVAWNRAERKVTITNADSVIEIVIDSQIAKINGEDMKLDAPAFIENSRTYLPLRFVAETLHAEVLWDAEERTTIILPADTAAEAAEDSADGAEQ